MHSRVCPECGAAFVPRSGRDLCCSDACRAARKRRLDTEAHRRLRGSKNKSVYKDDAVVVERVQRMTLAEEREEKARRRAAFFAARDAAFERAGLPIPKIEVRDGVRYESRGQCSIAPHFSPLVAVHRKGYYYR